MPYCPKCGVEVENNLRNCPLCDFEIPEIPNEIDAVHEAVELKNYYEELKQLKSTRRKRSKQIFLIVIILGVIGVVFNNTMQDWLGNSRFTFSPYVLSSLGLFIIALISVFRMVRGLKKNLLILFLGITAFLFSIDFYNDGIGWFLPLALPLNSAVFGMIFLTIVIIRKLKPGKMYSGSIILAAASILLIVVELIIDLNTGKLKLEWSLQALIPLVLVSLLFILGRSLIKHDKFAKLKRYMHL